MSIPRMEFPVPQFERKNWLNLNGEWDFEFDFGSSLAQTDILQRDVWSKKITVPFCPESELSGIGYKDFIPSVWYRKKVNIDKQNGRTFIHFGAVDYFTTVYVNGKVAGTHKGGYTSFCFEITDLIVPGENTIIVNAVDDTRSPYQATGKQSCLLKSHGCLYTRTTGIWQTVWLEFTPLEYVESFRLFPDAENGSIAFEAKVNGKAEFSFITSYEGKLTGSVTKKADNTVSGEIKLSEIHLWEPGNGRLYDIEMKFGEDIVKSYFGLRDISFSGYKFLINGKSVFQRLVLDQGFYPDGIYTAPNDAALLNDIKLSKAAGFNGARLHEKVFEPRFLYYADKEGYLTWGEYPNWGLDYSDPKVTEVYVNEWIEAVERDFNHPSIIGWCPFNETWNYEGREQRNELLSTVYHVTKALDKSRPCIDTSGNYHVITDIYDTHDYEQNPEIFKEHYDSFAEGGELYDHVNDRGVGYNGGLFFISEYGGIRWSVKPDGDGWGYGNAPKTGEEFIERYKGLTETLLGNKKMFGFCYTQLTDVEQEQNGIYTYERKEKFDPEIFRKINSAKAAVED
ncbi:MAG: beta-galactosidase [Clostridia bacterium]|nr:beta-galactosidase [Clostridia bacterium]